MVAEGDSLSEQRVDASLQALRLCGRFSEAWVDSSTIAGDSVTLKFICAPALQVRRIRVIGEYPFFESDIVRALSLHSGSIYTPTEVENQNTLITDLYKRDGFVAPEIRITSRPDSATRTCDIALRIHRGPYWRMKNLEVAGNRVFSTGQIQLLFLSWRRGIIPTSAGRFVETVFRKDIANLLARYRQKGFAESRIDYVIDTDSLRHELTARVRIEEGPRYTVAFKGNRHLRDRQLRKELTIFTEGDRNGRGVRKSATRILQRYRLQGYLRAAVKVEDTTLTAGKLPRRMVTVRITEGPVTRVRSLAISGNHAFPARDLRGRMFTRASQSLRRGAFNPAVFESDLAALTAMYASAGYERTEILPDVQWNQDSTTVDIRLTVKEDQPLRVKAIEFAGLSAISPQEARKALSMTEGTVFRDALVKQEESLLSRLIAEHGYPYVKVAASTDVDSANSSVALRYTVEEGKLVTIGNVYFSGNFKTRSRILRKEFGLRNGDPFSIVKYLEGQKDLRDLDILNSVKYTTIGLKERADKIDIFAEVEERKPYYAEVGGGYKSESGFLGRIKLGNRNLLGLNKSAFIGGQISEIQRLAEIGITEPRLLGTKVVATLDNVYEETQGDPQNLGYSTRTFSSLLNLKRKLTDNTVLANAVRFERRRQIPLGADGRPLTDSLSRIESQARSNFLFSPSFSIDRRDSYMRPTKGTQLLLQGDLAKGVGSSLHDDFFRVHADLAGYFSLPSKRVTFALRGQVWYIKPFGGLDLLPADRLFNLGGSATIRGYKENMLEYDSSGTALGGYAAGCANFETRIEVWKNIELVTFADGGQLLLQNPDAGQGRFRVSAGLGLRYVTPIGPIGVVYGWKINPRLGHEDLGRFHFSIGYMF
jgi:outer membrane protein insertion porin family